MSMLSSSMRAMAENASPVRQSRRPVRDSIAASCPGVTSAQAYETAQRLFTNDLRGWTGLILTHVDLFGAAARMLTRICHYDTDLGITLCRESGFLDGE